MTNRELRTLLEQYPDDCIMIIVDSNKVAKTSDEDGNCKGHYKHFTLDDEHIKVNILELCFNSFCSKDNPNKKCFQCDCWKNK